MASLNPGIILSGANPDLMGSVARGMQMRAAQQDMQQRQQLNALYQAHGQGLVSGDPTAINALAAINPAQAMQFQQQHTQGQRAAESHGMSMKVNEAQLANIHQQSKLRAAEEARKIGAEQAAAEAAQINQVLSSASAAYQQGPDAFAGYVQQVAPQAAQAGIDPATLTYENFPIIAAGLVGARDGISEAMNVTGAITGGQIDPAKVQSSVVLDDGTSVLIMNDGARRVLDARGAEVSGAAAARAIKDARDYTTRNQRDIYGARREGTLGADIALGGEAEATKDVAKASVDAGIKSWADYGKVQSSLSNIDEAIAAIDRGAASGLVYNMLPNVTEASASLNNAMNRMGLDVIGAVTFGALSEGELRLAMETAAPRNLEPQDLKAWLTRRRDAQAKAAVMLADAAQFLTTPGNTINDWIARNRQQGRETTPAPQAPPAPVQPQGGAWPTLDDGRPDWPNMTDEQMDAYFKAKNK